MADAAKPAMAPAVGEEAEEYESDPEDSLAAMRRREASDEEGEGERSDGDGEPAQEDRRIGSVGDSDGEGGAPGYDDDEEFEEEEEEDNLYEEDVEGDEEGLPEEEEVGAAAYVGGGGGGGVGRYDAPADGVESGGDGPGVGGEKGGSGEKNQPEEKESEPFAVPTAGAFCSRARPGGP